MSSASRSRASAFALTLACTAMLCAPLPAWAQTPPPAPAPAPETPEVKLPPDTVLATVNGKKITQEDVNLASEDLGQSLQQLKGKARDAYVLDYLVDSALVSQKAKSEKLDETPEFGRKLVFVNDKLLMEALLSKIAQSATSDATLHKIYDDAAKQQKPQEEIHARHILVPTEADAQAALKRVKSGEDFAKVAKEVSKDPGSLGGDLGWFTKERMVPAFADAAFKLQEGQISDPVKTQFGWHIIKLEGKRQKTFPPFEQVRDQIVRYAMQKAQSELIIELRKTAKIERSDKAPATLSPQDVTPAPAGGGAPPPPPPPAGK